MTVWRALDDAVDVLLVFVGVSMVAGWVGVATRRRGRAEGDAVLAAALDAVADRRVRAFAVAVVDLAGDPVRRTAFIDADTETRFEIGSVTKGLTGLLVADAVERGEVTLATTVGELVPRLGEGPLRTVTLRELVTHSSGLPRLPRDPRLLLRIVASNYAGTDPYRGLTAWRVLRDAAGQRLRGRGSSRYSNLGAAVAGQALAEHAATGYPELLRERILRPLGMTATSAEADGVNGARRGYTRAGRRSSPWRLSGYAPAGGVVSTIDDMATLVEALLRGTAPGMAALEPLGVPGTGRREQAGFWIVQPGDDGEPVVWHNGGTGGYSAFLAVHPQSGRGVVALSNVADAGRTQRLAEAVLDAHRVTA